MKKLIYSKPFIAATAFVGSAVSAFAETATTGVQASLVDNWITDGKTQLLLVLSAGSVIMGCFYVWGLIKRALMKTR